MQAALWSLVAARRCASALSSCSYAVGREWSSAGAASSGRIGGAVATATASAALGRSAHARTPPRLWAGLATSAARQVSGARASRIVAQ